MVAGSGGGAARNDTPERYEGGDVERRSPEFGHEQVGGDLEGDVTDVEDRETCVVFLVFKAEIADETVVASGAD